MKPENVNEAETNRTAEDKPRCAPATGSAYLVDTTAYGPAEYPTISKALDEQRIISITKCEDGRFELRERCDDYFAAYLPREQLVAWANELLALAGMPNDEDQQIAGDGASAAGRPS